MGNATFYFQEQKKPQPKKRVVFPPLQTLFRLYSHAPHIYHYCNLAFACWHRTTLSQRALSLLHPSKVVISYNNTVLHWVKSWSYLSEASSALNEGNISFLLN